jgi:carboxymethylenebutenolidase
LKDACPIVARYGAKDRSQRGAAAKLERILDALGIDNDVKEYPSAVHPFLSKHPKPLAILQGAAGPDATLPRFFTVLNVVSGPLTGMGFDAEQSADARSRIVSFFDRYLATARDPN